MKKQKFKFKQLLNKYRSLFYEVKYLEEILLEGNQEFEIYYRRYCADNNIDLEELNRSHANKVETIFSNQSSVIKAIESKNNTEDFDSKDLFRQIAKRFHPDTLAIDDPLKNEYEEVFKKASGAIDSGHWGELFDIADQYDLDLENYEEMSLSLNLDIERITKLVRKKKGSYAWLLYECEENNDCKDNVVKKFLKHLFNI